MTDDLIESVQRLLEASREPLSARVLAARLLDQEADREILPYRPAAAFHEGERIAWDSPAGRLIGDVISCERVGSSWRLVVDWDRKLSPGLERYQKSRKGTRLSYLFDPSGERPSGRVDPNVAAGGGPTLVDLLEADLEEQLDARHGFVEWSGQWTTWRQLPRLDEDELARCLLKATADDGIAQTNQVLELMRLPGSDQPGHGLAAMAVNLKVERQGGWVWGGSRDGGEWLPANAIALVFAQFGRAPRVEEALRAELVPDLADDALPEPLAAFVADQTIRGLDLRDGQGPLVHPLSRWERANGVIALDVAEIGYFPSQARIFLVFDGIESPALVDASNRLIHPDAGEFRARMAAANAVTFQRFVGTDTFGVTFHSGGPATEPSEWGTSSSVLQIVLGAFANGQARTVDEVMEHVLHEVPGDRSVVARIVATYLATYACFRSSDDRVYEYQPDQPHNASIPVRTVRVSDIAQRATKAFQAAKAEDRSMRQYRLAERAPHMVRGHLRQLGSRRRASSLQLAIARRHGLVVPPGSTFVRPHRRKG